MCAILGINEREGSKQASKQKKREFGFERKQLNPVVYRAALQVYKFSSMHFFAILVSAVAFLRSMLGAERSRRASTPNSPITRGRVRLPPRNPCVCIFENVPHDAELGQDIGTR
jgi:hypothetical protein